LCSVQQKVLNKSIIAMKLIHQNGITLNTTMKVVGAFLLGTAIGTATGLLVAPSSGSATRKQLKKKTKKYSQEALDMATDYLDSLRKGYNKKIERYAGNGKTAIDSLKENIKL